MRNSTNKEFHFYNIYSYYSIRYLYQYLYRTWNQTKFHLRILENELMKRYKKE